MKLLAEFIYWVKWQISCFKTYVFMGDFRKKHISISREGYQLKLTVKNHHPFIREKQRLIKKYLKTHTEEESIRFALKEAIDGCTCVDFTKDNKSVHFWLTRGNLDFFLTHGLLSEFKPYRKYHYSVIGLLAEFDFVKDTFGSSVLPSIFSAPRHYIYKIEDHLVYKKITGYFHKRVDQATEFTMKLFKEVYKVKKGKLKVEVG